MSNPSHLEAVNPVVEGKTKCKQYYRGDKNGEHVMSIQIHGDAAFPGQGVVYETINMSGLPDYTTGGTIHLVINNQIGFTTDPKFSRSSIYCTEPAKISGAPIFHVNGDDPEAVVRVMDLAAQYRAEFKSDVCVDIISYRRFGHNEIDEPAFTQPLMYDKIRNHMQPTLMIYKDLLLKQGFVSDSEFQKMENECMEILESEFVKGKSYVVHPSDWLESNWKDFKGPNQLARINLTGVSMENLQKIGKAISTVPKGFELHHGVKKIVEARKKMFETGKAIDWGTAEALAFGTTFFFK